MNYDISNSFSLRDFLKKNHPLNKSCCKHKEHNVFYLI